MNGNGGLQDNIIMLMAPLGHGSRIWGERGYVSPGGAALLWMILIKRGIGLDDDLHDHEEGVG